MGYADPQSPRMRGTLVRVRERLGVDAGVPDAHAGALGWGGLLYPLSGRRRWAAGVRRGIRHLQLLGRRGSGAGGRRYRRTPRLRAPGVVRQRRWTFAEEIDPRSGAAIGNFPQAFTHVGLINAAVTVARLQRESPAAPPVEISDAGRRGHI